MTHCCSYHNGQLQLGEDILQLTKMDHSIKLLGTRGDNKNERV